MTEQRVALVTGANKGIGFAIARALLGQGIVVYLGARDAARGERAAAELAGAGPGARFVHLDVTDPASAADQNGHQGVLTPDQGAKLPVRMATLPAGGPTGTAVTADTDLTQHPLPW